ncbi:MAG: ethanolamine ammonia-lyase subunit EutB [Candidatus Nanopelagicales bacterium]
MRRSATIGQHTYTFADLREVMAKATPERSGDHLAAVSAHSEQERVAAQVCLADTPLRAFLDETLVPYEIDEVTRLILDTHDTRAFEPIAALTVGEFRDHLLAETTDADALADLAPGITPEMAAAVSKIMRNQDLVAVASRCQVVTAFRNTLGLPGRLSSRIQPNDPTDDPRGIAASIVDGLLYGCGDACIGINPATDSVRRTVELVTMLDDIISTYSIPTQSCVLAHLSNTLLAIEAGAPVDLVFQSIAGTQAANQSFGISLGMLREAHDAARSLGRGSVGNNVMYFETGQGSCLSADAHHGVDQQTLEARAYGVARAFSPLLVNTVVGFIGPEYLYDGKQIRRAGLEDHFCGKLLGLPMGVDVCFTAHAEADSNDSDDLMTLLGVAGCTYFMGVPGADDVMLEYQSTSYHDIAYLHRQLDKRPAPEFDLWLQARGITNRLGLLQVDDGPHPLREITL